MNENALMGIRVLDFTWLLAGPYATRILADFGAEVIKVQSNKSVTGAESNTTGYFNNWNRNKLGITLNMSHPEARELALKLIGICDVLIQNFTPRVMVNWDLTYEALKEIKSDIIMVSMSGMGQTGPWRDFAALGHTIQALSGITYLTSPDQGPPAGIGYAYSDIVAGSFAAMAILAALEFRSKTGRGQYIDISEYEAMCTLLGPTILDCSVNHAVTVPSGNDTDYIPAAPYGCYKCLGEERWCVIAVFGDDEWLSLCQVMGNPDWTKQEKFSTHLKRKENVKELNELLEHWTINHTPEEIMTLLQEANIAASVVNDASNLANNPQLKARGFFFQAQHPVLGDCTFDSTPINLSRTPPRFQRAAPLLGQDNMYVYNELLGLDNQQLSHYIAKGIIS